MEDPSLHSGADDDVDGAAMAGDAAAAVGASAFDELSEAVTA